MCKSIYCFLKCLPKNKCAIIVQMHVVSVVVITHRQDGSVDVLKCECSIIMRAIFRANRQNGTRGVDMRAFFFYFLIF